MLRPFVRASEKSAKLDSGVSGEGSEKAGKGTQEEEVLGTTAAHSLGNPYARKASEGRTGSSNLCVLRFA